MSTDSIARFAPGDLVALIHDGEIAVGKVRFVTDAGVDVPFDFTYSVGVGGATRERAGRPESELAPVDAVEDAVTVDFPNGTRVEVDTPLDGALTGTVTAHAISGYDDYRPIVAFDSGNVRAVAREDISESQELGNRKAELDSQKRRDDVDSDTKVVRTPIAADE
ncbi:uncharacterized protein HfgLR_25180 (plasmid) [Haloferax gibbonsii]|uniref:Uncharacterized protein n=1 Tax=Haloferax gibbonsii TaxID=35746 RepID=A0A871BN49_HALGI|nr:hypothetical protein [Haloferax gibbonsii]QOS14114.1 uncharacterized protein HfgLR_25180 [Haloferax gibbonsii]